MRSVALFDMDGVLCQFVAGALAVHGKSLHHAETQWDFCTQIGFNGPGDPAFWRPLENAAFWAMLEPHIDGMRLLTYLEERIGEDRIGILSSGLCLGSVDGKRMWLRRHLPKYEKRAIFCTVKELVAGPGKVLIDDHDPNVNKFAAVGGHAVLVPRPWNTRKGQLPSRYHLREFDPELLLTEVMRKLEGADRCDSPSPTSGSGPVTTAAPLFTEQLYGTGV